MVDSQGKHDISGSPGVVGGIRVSPDGKFLAFGEGFSGYTRLRICELGTRTCQEGPTYTEWIAGRETFWIKH